MNRITALLAGLVFFLLQGCTPGSIVIGYSAQLTGPQADTGVQGRNGATLAVERLNAAGGIHGRPLELLVADDGTTPEEAVNADMRLVGDGAAAIIGHITSTKTLAALPYLSRLDIPLITPTASSAELEGASPLLFRMNSSSGRSAAVAAGYLHDELGVTKAAVVLDRDNTVLSEAFYGAFRKSIEHRGGSASAITRFSARTNPDREELAAKALESGPDGIVIIASAYDTALIASAVRRLTADRSAGPGPVLLSTGWAGTNSLVRFGGKAAEGMIIVDTFSESVPVNDEHLLFAETFRRRFGSPLSFAAAQAYDAVMFLAEGLARCKGDTEALPGTLKEIRTFKGAWETVELSDSGEALRPVLVSRIQNGTFVLLRTVPVEGTAGQAP